MSRELFAALELMSRRAQEYDDDKIRTCAQCGGNDGFMYSTKAPGEWLCGECNNDRKMEEYQKRVNSW